MRVLSMSIRRSTYKCNKLYAKARTLAIARGALFALRDAPFVCSVGVGFAGMVRNRNKRHAVLCNAKDE